MPNDITNFVVEGYYDFQDIRISNNNRIRGLIRSKIENIPHNKIEDKKTHKDFIEMYEDRTIKEMVDYAMNLMNEEEQNYLNRVINASNLINQTENEFKKLMNEYLSNEPIWTGWLANIKGISGVLGGNLMHLFGYGERFDNIGKIWAYSGYSVNNGLAPKRKKGELVNWNPKARKLGYKISDSFIKQRTPIYRDIYDSEKELQLLRKYKKGELMKKYGKPYKKEDTHLSKGHADMRARRKMVKLFLSHYWQVGRTMKGLPITKPYPIAKLEGHTSMINPPNFAKPRGE